MSSCVLDIKKKQASLSAERTLRMKTKLETIKKKRLEEYNMKTNAMNEKEKALCRKTNQLVDELVLACDDTPFHKALVKILGNLKGIRTFLPSAKKNMKY